MQLISDNQVFLIRKKSDHHLIYLKKIMIGKFLFRNKMEMLKIDFKILIL